MKLLFIIGVISVISSTYAEETRLDDLSPNEAQQIIDKQDLSLKYAPKIESNVPALRYLGNVQHEVLEDIYLAKQFHGQDGIGGYVYGYAVPDIAKSEKKVAGGDLTGSYSYINGDGQEIKVEYWDNGNGFHQTDNLPKVELIPNEDTPEVKAAKEEHFRIWKEQAERNKAYGANTDLYNVYNEDPEQGKWEEEAARYNQPEVPYVKRPEEEDPEPVKDPKGFFYAFDYPAGIIVDKGRAVGGVQQKRETEQNEQLFSNTRAILNGGH